MGSWLLSNVAHILDRELNTTDPRIGSSRDNATAPSAARITQGTNSASFSTLFSTFVPVAIYASVCIIIFFIGRRKFERVYAPRTFLNSLETHERILKLPSGWLDWVVPFCKIHDTALLKHSSLEAYLFLRYLKILCVICGVGCLITWPVLIPLHRYGGNGKKQLDMLTSGNIRDHSWYYVHAFQAWIFFGFILYMISRECVHFVNLRQAYLLSPYYADRLSSRTVLFTCVPQQILEERKLRKIFGTSVKNVWIPKETDDLDDLVKERDQTATRLEKAEIVLIKKVNVAYMKAAKDGHPDINTTRWSEDSTKKDPKVSVRSVSETPPRSIRVKEVEIEFESPTASSPGQLSTENENIISPTSPSSPQEYSRHDGTPLFKTNYGIEGPPDVNGSVAAQWIPYNWRPTHRPLANYGRRVDTIKWTRKQLRELAPEISKLKALYKQGKGRPIGAAFIEFESQVDAQSAYQTLAHHRASHMAPEVVGVRPQEIVWSSLEFQWWQRIVRQFAIKGVIAVMIVFWAMPSGLVGAISNIKFLTDTLPFLKWINKLPTVILGLISGLLPAVGLSLLMSLPPIILRELARQAGVTTFAKVELYTQNAYFIFQVVQVFLVTTLTSAVSGAIGDIIRNPLSAKDLLSANLPKSSNFYVSYFILQGLAMSATRMVHLGSLFRHQIMANTGDNPRLKSRKFHRLRVIHWGAIYPVFTNMGVIAISYAIIAPIILGVAFLGLGIIYTTYRYNLLYIYSSSLDARGLHYPRALKQTLAGVYLGEICLIGLVGLGGSFGPLVLLVGLLVFTVLVHFSLSDALSPLLYNLPRTLAAEEELRRAGYGGLDCFDKSEPPDVENPDPYDSDFDPSNPTENSPSHGETTNRAVEGGTQVLKLTHATLANYIHKRYSASPLPALISPLNPLNLFVPLISPTPTLTPNFFLKFLHPEVFADYHILRQSVDETEFPEIRYADGEVKNAFDPPGMRKRKPGLWIPKDIAGVSVQECRHSMQGGAVGMHDGGAWVDEKGVVSVDFGIVQEGGVDVDSWERVRF